MITKTYHLEFLTPCFCAGADQTHAELRPPAIRGQLHWWFRALGGGAEEEREIFGSVHGDAPSASSLVIRTVTDGNTGQKDWFTNANIPQRGMGNRTYLLGFFCGRTGRLQPGGALPPGSTGKVSLIFRRPPGARIELAARAFFSVGAFGFRISRAAGAFCTREHTLTAASWSLLVQELERAGFKTALLPDEFSNWVSLCDRAGSYLKNHLRSKEGLGISAGKSGTAANALGSADPRQTSVVQFRPVRVDGKLRLALLEAPHARTLGPEARRAHGSRGSILKEAGLA
jgi:CRISPR type III-B/RAMP module RAMP protein Cmr1